MGSPKHKMFEHPDDYKLVKMLIYNFNKFYNNYHSSDRGKAAKFFYFLRSCLPYDIGLEIGFPKKVCLDRIRKYRKSVTKRQRAGSVCNGLHVRNYFYKTYRNESTTFDIDLSQYVLLESCLINPYFRRNAYSYEEGIFYSSYSRKGRKFHEYLKRRRRISHSKFKSLTFFGSYNDCGETEFQVRFNTKNVFGVTMIYDLYTRLLKDYKVNSKLLTDNNSQNALHIRVDCSKFVNEKRLSKLRPEERMIEFMRIVQSLILCESFFMEINFYFGNSFFTEYPDTDPTGNTDTPFSTFAFDLKDSFAGRNTFSLKSMALYYSNPSQARNEDCFRQRNDDKKLSTKSQSIEFRMQNNVMSFEYVMLRIFLYSYFVYLLETTNEIVSPEKLKTFWEKIQK